ncbi:MAG: DinB family protein [Gemmatimonadota bacterium]
MNDIGTAFLHVSSNYLSAEFLPRIKGAIERLPEEDLWWRPNEASNSVGNLVLHLTGNIRQWIVSGVGGAPDVRRRQEEFEHRVAVPRQELVEGLERAVADACAVLAVLPLSRLGENVTVQGRSVSAFEAVYHAVEHFSMHTGQIIYVAKLRTSEDLGFYELVDGVPRARWPGQTRG